MKRIMTTAGAFLMFLITLITVIVGLRLPNDALAVIAGGILISIVLVAVACIWYIKLMAGINLDIKRGESRIVQAKANEADANAKAAKYREYKDGFGMLHLLNLDTDIIENLSAFPGTHHNGTWVEPPPAAAAAWHALVGRRASGSPVELLASGQVPSQQLDCYTALSDPLQVYAIIGPQRIGKSRLAMKLTDYLIRQGRICVVIGTKAESNEWAECKRFIGNDSVLAALNSLLLEVDKRLRSGRKIPALCVFLDDWINSTVLDSELAERFFIEASTRMLTTGIVPYFLLQSDSKADWGTKHGATLKNNFVHLLLSAPRVNGQLDHSQLKGEIIYPGDKQRHLVRLPEPAQVILQPTAQERQVINLAESGVSMNEIARQVFGSIGGNQNKTIKEILAKYGM